MAQLAFAPFPLEPNRRLSTEQVPSAVNAGAVLLDIRSQSARSRQGALHGAIAVDRFSLPARCTPGGPQSLARAEDSSVWWVLVSANGSSSADVARRLRAAGLHRVSDVVGGFTALRAARRALAAASVEHAARERITLAAHL